MNVATSQTLAFVLESVPEPKARILEVECGTGELALELKKHGYYITCIDKSADKIASAKEMDLDAHAVDLMDFQTTETYDAVLFSRSLHSMPSLDTALKKAKSFLRSKGRLLVEDFAHDAMDEKTAALFYEVKDLLASMRGDVSVENEFPPVAIDRWKKQYAGLPSIHNSQEIVAAISRNFETNFMANVPYLYRSFQNELASTENRDAVLERIFRREKELIEAKVIVPVGLRVVAKMYFSYLR